MPPRPSSPVIGSWLLERERKFEHFKNGSTNRRRFRRKEQIADSRLTPGKPASPGKPLIDRGLRIAECGNLRFGIRSPQSIGCWLLHLRAVALPSCRRQKESIFCPASTKR